MRDESKGIPLLHLPPMDLVLFGIQGSGKGTQAKRLAADFGYEIFEAGGELRKMASEGSVLGNAVKSFIDVGKLVPFEIIMAVLEKAVKAKHKNQKILFDGIPRDTDQKKSFDEIMKKLGRDFRCLHIKLDPEEGVQRILKRAQIEGRADDAKEETIRKRMNTFTEKTLPVIEAYEKDGKVSTVEGTGSVEEIYERVKRIME